MKTTLTTQEQLNFCENLNNKKGSLTCGELNMADTIIQSFLIVFNTTVAFCFSPLTFVPAFLISLSVAASFAALTFVRHKNFKKFLNKISNGKITYKQFKKIRNSGELAKWQCNLNKQQAIIEEEYVKDAIYLTNPEISYDPFKTIAKNNETTLEK